MKGHKLLLLPLQKNLRNLGFINQIWFSVFAYSLNVKEYFTLLVDATKMYSVLVDPALRCGFQVLLFENCVIFIFCCKQNFSREQINKQQNKKIINKNNIISQVTKTILTCSRPPRNFNRSTIDPIIREYRTQGLSYLHDGQGRYVWIIVNPRKLAAQIIPTRSGVQP